ncbi:MAG: hypothetical protein AMK70_09335 [Nitrospira bacterium SG8_35_1]|nr:MAG: hypothetical protein AMK70_09335 [Nitrospira bacterium SG8_35_1]
MSSKATEEQLLYANILEKGMLVGLILMFITFALYVFGIMPAAIPVSEISSYWNQPVHDYLVAINENFLHWDHLVTGWSWIKLIGMGDFINFIPIAILSGVTIICYLAIVPGLFKRGDKAYAIMALAEAAILTLAASGLLAVGH